MASLDFSTVLAIGIHDMKNSLNRVLTALDELSPTALDETAPCDAAAITQLHYEAQRMKDNLTKMLMLYREGHGLYEPQYLDASIYELLEDCWLNNKPLMDQRALSYELDCDEALSWTLDRYLVESLVENVLTNTIRYTKSIIRVLAWCDQDWLFVSIEDDGPGYPPNMMGVRTLHDTRAPDAKLGNTGVGLHFCALVAERHHHPTLGHGEIALSNGGALGGGRFLLQLPRLD